VFVTAPHAIVDVDAVAMVAEHDSVSYVMRTAAAQAAGLTGTFRCRRIDLGVDTALAAVGFMARLTGDLALQGIAVNPISGYHRDHLFVPAERANDAVKVLADAVDRARLALGRRRDDDPATAALLELATDLWICDGPTVPFLGMPYPTRMTVIRLDDGGLFVHSPVELTAALEAAVLAVGEPRHLVAPNKLHHLFMAEWAQRFPHADVYGAAGVAARLPGIAVKPLDQVPPWRDEIDQLTFAGSAIMEELVFFHRASRTLLVADLIENLDPAPLNGWQRALARITGIVAPRGSMPRVWRITFYGRGRDTARCCARQILAWQPQRVVLSHGHVVEAAATTFVANALRAFQ
jgi:hypothetical protein